MGVSRQPSTVEPFFADDSFDDAFARLRGAVRFHGQEHHANAVFAGGRQGEAEFGAFRARKTVRDLDQDAGAIARFRIAAAGAAMGQVDQDLDALYDDVVRFLALDVGHKADAAGVVLMARVVEALRSG